MINRKISDTVTRSREIATTDDSIDTGMRRLN